MPLHPLHLSHSVHHGDGGIAFAVADLMHAQQELGIYSRWLSADRFEPLNRDQSFANAVLDTGATVLHCHGLWRTQTRVAKQFIKAGLPIIVSPHGMMDQWAMAHSSWKKEIVWHLWEEEVLRSASCLHALCHAEAEAIARRLPGKPIALIPNGISSPDPLILSKNLLPWTSDIPSDSRVLLFLGRFHQKKGLEPLMAAWQSVIAEAKRLGWWLVFVGFGDDHKFENQLQSFPVDNCRAYGPVFDQQKIACYQHSSAFILPSYSEGLPMAALEAMSHGLPCFLSSACNLPEAFTANAASIAEPDSSQLALTLRCLFSRSEEELTSMGMNGRCLTQQQFDWDHVARKSIEVYRWILGEAPRPPCIVGSTD